MVPSWLREAELMNLASAKQIAEEKHKESQDEVEKLTSEVNSFYKAKKRDKAALRQRSRESKLAKLGQSLYHRHTCSNTVRLGSLIVSLFLTLCLSV